MSPRHSLSLLVLCSIFTFSCGDDGGTEPENGETPVDGIGTTGGVVSTESGDGTVAIPAGAISSGEVEITVEEMARSGYPDPDGRWSDVFEFGPDGAEFDLPVTISIAIADSLAGSAGTLWSLNESTDQWEEIPLSHTSNGRVWGQTMHFSAYSAGPASNPDECTWRESISLRTPGNVEVLIADLDVTQFVGVGTLFEQETGSRWITQFNSFTVQGIAGPPSGQGKWIDFATGPNFETGTFAIAENGTFAFDLEIPPLGFRFLGLTDGCLAPVATPENGWYYNLEVWCGEACASRPDNVAGCNFPATVTMQPNNDWVETFWGFLEDQGCTLGQELGIVRAITFRLFPSGSRTATVIAGVHRWEILSSSHGTSNNPANLWNELPDATEITMRLRDAFDSEGATYELSFRFDGGDFSVNSFIEE